ncbi:MAG: monovalent cation/H(+) antiporter subunit G [Pusillimonas sp.]
MIDTLPVWISIPVALLLVISGVLTLTGSLGLLRLPSFYSRIHAPTLGNTLGVFCVLVASILISSTLEQRVVVHQILITVFLVITSPVTATLLMRAAIKRQAREEERLAQQGPIADLPHDQEARAEKEAI